jgi:tripartite-type tricarboxylate transporter receptor subunit TctC
MKAKQSTAKYGSAGAGSASHVSCILLNAALGVDIVHIPYRGLGPAMQDLIAGRIDYMCDSPSTSRPQVETGNVKAIATTGAKRTSVLPDVPTAHEQGLDFEVMAWQGLFLPRDTPEPIVRRLSEALSAALDSPSVGERFKAVGEDVPAVERRSPEYLLNSSRPRSANGPGRSRRAACRLIEPRPPHSMDGRKAARLYGLAR